MSDNMYILGSDKDYSGTVLKIELWGRYIAIGWGVVLDE